MSLASLRPITAEDAPALADIHGMSFFESAWDAAAIEGARNSPGAFGLVGCVGAEPAGFILMRAIAGEAEVLTIAVDPVVRRCGVGRALLIAGLALAVPAGAGAVFLEVDESNAGAIALYESEGFKLAGRRRTYYSSGADALVYRRDLNSRDVTAYP